MPRNDWKCWKVGISKNNLMFLSKSVGLLDWFFAQSLYKLLTFSTKQRVNWDSKTVALHTSVTSKLPPAQPHQKSYLLQSLQGHGDLFTQTLAPNPLPKRMLSRHPTNHGVHTFFSLTSQHLHTLCLFVNMQTGTEYWNMCVKCIKAVYLFSFNMYVDVPWT